MGPFRTRNAYQNWLDATDDEKVATFIFTPLLYSKLFPEGDLLYT